MDASGRSATSTVEPRSVSREIVTGASAVSCGAGIAAGSVQTAMMSPQQRATTSTSSTRQHWLAGQPSSVTCTGGESTTQSFSASTPGQARVRRMTQAATSAASAASASSRAVAAASAGSSGGAASRMFRPARAAASATGPQAGSATSIHTASTSSVKTAGRSMYALGTSSRAAQASDSSGSGPSRPRISASAVRSMSALPQLRPSVTRAMAGRSGPDSLRISRRRSRMRSPRRGSPGGVRTGTFTTGPACTGMVDGLQAEATEVDGSVAQVPEIVARGRCGPGTPSSGSGRAVPGCRVATGSVEVAGEAGRHRTSADTGARRRT